MELFIYCYLVLKWRFYIQEERYLETVSPPHDHRSAPDDVERGKLLFCIEFEVICV